MSKYTDLKQAIGPSRERLASLANLGELRVALRDPNVATPADFLRVAFASPGIEKVLVARLEPGEWTAPYLHEYGSPEDNPDAYLHATFGPGRYKFHAYASRSETFAGSLLAFRVYMIPADYAEPAPPKKPREKPEEVTANLRKQMAESLESITSAKTIATLTQQPNAGAGTAEALSTVEKVAAIVSNVGKSSAGSGDAMWLKMFEFITEQNRLQMAMMQRQIDLLATREDGRGEKDEDDIDRTVTRLTTLAKVFGVELGRGGAGGGGGKYAWLAPVIEQGIASLADPIKEIVHLRREELAARAGVALPATPAGSHPAVTARREAPLPEASTMARGAQDPQWAEILSTLVEELSRPADDLDAAGLAAWLETIVITMGPDGPVTLYDRVLPMIDAPERLVRVSIKAISPQLATDAVWPGVLRLFEHIRAAEAENDAKDPGEE